MNTQLPEEHPLTKASWLWPGGQLYIYNQYASFRKDFDLEDVPVDSKIYITADQSYRLYINGKYICRGPARGYQSHWPFDEVDVSDKLKKGHNWISVIAYNPGCSNFQYRHEGIAGFLCALKSGEKIIVSNRSWNMRRMPGYQIMTHRYSLQLAFQESLDSCMLDNDWIYEEKVDLDWEDPEMRKFVWEDCYQFGRTPYDTMEERGIPLLAEYFVLPSKVICTAKGKCENNYKNWDNISWGWVREATACSVWEPSHKSPITSKDGFELNLPITGQDNYISYTIDAGEYCVGTLAVDISDALGDEILDFQFHERMVGNRPSIRPEGAACQVALANRIKLNHNETSHEFFHPLGFRYFSVIIRNSQVPVKLKIKIRKVHYPFTMEGNFNCSDNNLNEIFDISRRTQQICSLDAYVDTPWREQAQWWGDARVQAHNTFYLDGDPKLLARGIRSIAGQTTLQGLTFGHAPTVAYNCILPDFSLTWIMTLWDYYWQTGEIELFNEQYPRVQALMDYFDSKEARAENGLLCFDQRYWYFGDWSDIFKGYIPTYLNLWYLYTLRYLIRLFKVAGMNSKAVEFENKAEKHQNLVLKYLFIEDKQHFCGGLDKNLNQSNQYSVHDQLISILQGIKPEIHDKLMQDWVLPYLTDKEFNGAKPSAFWSSYVLEEAGERGYAKEVIQFIKKHWTPMLETGTTWEQFGWSEKENETASHAWSAHPAYHFTNILTGIRQIAPAWEEISFSPNFVKGINDSSSIIPSPKGKIKASWKVTGNKYSAKLDIPEGITAKVSLPDCKAEYNESKLYTFEGNL